MSYAQQYDDRPGEWFQENPPNALKGDEHFIRGTWQPCIQYQVGICSVATARRRLIQSGEGFRILGLKEVLKSRAIFEATRDGLTWMKDQVADDEEWTPQQYVAYDKNIIAIRVPIAVEQQHQPRTGLPKPGEAFIAKRENGNVIGFEKGMPSESRIKDYFSDKVIAWFPLADIKWIKVEDVKEDVFQAYWTPIADALLKNHTPDEVYEKRCVAEDAWTAASDKAREGK